MSNKEIPTNKYPKIVQLYIEPLGNEKPFVGFNKELWNAFSELMETPCKLIHKPQRITDNNYSNETIR
jgi:hypothetical protein